MAIPKVFITRRLPEKCIKPLQQVAEVKMWSEEYKPVPREVLLQEVQTSHGLLTMLSDRVDETLLAQAPQLKCVANLAVGYDNIDLEACRLHHVIPCNTPDVLTETTADLVFALLMASGRRLIEANDYLKQGKWQEWGPFLMAGADIHHKTIGIVGMGRIGTAVARRAQGFAMNVIYHNRRRNVEAESELGARFCGFESLLETADFVVNLIPYTETTKGLFNQNAFTKMKKTALFINAGRGATVDEDALYQALLEGEIAGAGLDVFSQEPIPKEHPLLTLEQVVALPHIGSASVETRKQMISLCCKNLMRTLAGEKPITPIETSR
ncbi:glyoxylate reductase [Pullulanibacillus pueri]|uniref:Glyoxylate/hydroxypyruvate reductase B n=1 Tax=Pullulanibacillus pueri TaxID=1437324 RepID=A0A8J3EJQ4_9BACL|nr:D-glycerate dehydrogenase [Pullulanibacillus pueri]MBM7680429.1 glyoxylate reductase [Pullulanibacillus pueri]GGH75129.1 D-glycerate dehydrogenase [Pullulanibacillus pueri]